MGGARSALLDFVVFGIRCVGLEALFDEERDREKMRSRVCGRRNKNPSRERTRQEDGGVCVLDSWPAAGRARLIKNTFQVPYGKFMICSMLCRCLCRCKGKGGLLQELCLPAAVSLA